MVTYVIHFLLRFSAKKNPPKVSVDSLNIIYVLNLPDTTINRLTTAHHHKCWSISLVILDKFKIHFFVISSLIR